MTPQSTAPLTAVGAGRFPSWTPLAALILALVLAWANFALTVRWAEQPGALHGSRRPFYVASLLLVSILCIVLRGRVGDPVRLGVRLTGVVLASGVGLLVTSLVCRLLPSLWRQIPFKDRRQLHGPPRVPPVSSVGLRGPGRAGGWFDWTQPLAQAPVRVGLPGNARRGALPALALIGLYLLVYVGLDSLRFPLRGDEVHFWRNTVRFAQTLFPPVELLRDYGELNTPLPFVIWGALEYLFGQGIWLARLTNFLTSFVIVLLVFRSGGGTGDWRPYAAAAGLLICPYYLFVSSHVYTDIIPTFLVLIGVALHFDRRYVLGAVAFVLAIAGRQYMLAFPAALVAFELLRTRDRTSDPIRYLAPAVACASIAGWYLFFGGFAPSEEVARQGLVTSAPERLIPRNSLYFMGCIGFYYAIPSLVVRRDRLREEVTGPGAVLLAVVLLALFFFHAPLQNQNFGIPSMGVLDRVVRAATGDPGRVAVFFLLALTAAVRVRTSLLAALLLASNAILMMKAHIAWDKYALPLIVVLWYLEGSGKWNVGDVRAVAYESPPGAKDS